MKFNYLFCWWDHEKKPCFRHQQNEVRRTGWSVSVITPLWQRRCWVLLPLVHGVPNVGTDTIMVPLHLLVTLEVVPVNASSWPVIKLLRKNTAFSCCLKITLEIPHKWSPQVVLSFWEVVLLQQLTWQRGWMPHLLAKMNDWSSRDQCLVQCCQTRKQSQGAAAPHLCTCCCVPG